MELKGKKATVVGLGREGIALVRFLGKQGAHITVSDMKPAEKLTENLKQIQRLPVKLSLGGNRVEDMVQADVVFVSPGVPLNIPSLAIARQKGIAISSLTKLFFQLCPAPIVGITGSSGKTTTTALVGEVFKAAKRHVFVGGNIGLPLLEQVGEMTKDSWVVLELSSFQLELMDESPHVATITNISPNHLDMHPTMEHYIEAKKNILRYQKADDWAILNYDDPVTRGLASQCQSQALFFSQSQELKAKGAFLRDSQVVMKDRRGEKALFSTKDIKLLGRHNIENVLTACAIAVACDIPEQAITEAATSFRGVEHRLELVRKVNGVAYYNDSIATTPERTVAGLSAFDRPIILLAGGRDKHLPLEPLAAAVHQKCKAVILFGEAAPLLEGAIRGHQGESRLESLVRATSFSQAVEEGYKLATPGDIVLLSPACTSFDLFADFEERGREFKRLVGQLQNLPGEVSK